MSDDDREPTLADALDDLAAGRVVPLGDDLREEIDAIRRRDADRHWKHAGWVDRLTTDGRRITELRIDPDRFPLRLVRPYGATEPDGSITDAYVDGHGAVFIEVDVDYDDSLWVATLSMSADPKPGVVGLEMSGTLIGAALSPLSGWPWPDGPSDHDAPLAAPVVDAEADAGSASPEDQHGATEGPA